MLHPTGQLIEHFQDSFDPPTEYRLTDVRLEILDERTALFTAGTQGPPGTTVWVRAWLSNQPDGMLAEAEIGEVAAGATVTLKVTLEHDATPTLACMRIESERFATKHTLHVSLTD